MGVTQSTASLDSASDDLADFAHANLSFDQETRKVVYDALQFVQHKLHLPIVVLENLEFLDACDAYSMQPIVRCMLPKNWQCANVSCFGNKNAHIYLERMDYFYQTKQVLFFIKLQCLEQQAWHCTMQVEEEQELVIHGVKEPMVMESSTHGGVELVELMNNVMQTLANARALNAKEKHFFQCISQHTMHVTVRTSMDFPCLWDTAQMQLVPHRTTFEFVPYFAFAGMLVERYCIVLEQGRATSTKLYMRSTIDMNRVVEYDQI